jgi:hypothetical protein
MRSSTRRLATRGFDDAVSVIGLLDRGFLRLPVSMYQFVCSQRQTTKSQYGQGDDGREPQIHGLVAYTLRTRHTLHSPLLRRSTSTSD